MWTEREGALRAQFATGSFVAGMEFLQGVTELAEAANHHPDVVLRYPSVEIALFSHDVNAITERDHALAAQISSLASERGITEVAV